MTQGRTNQNPSLRLTALQMMEDTCCFPLELLSLEAGKSGATEGHGSCQGRSWKPILRLQDGEKVSEGLKPSS